MKILITGGAGFIGSNLVRALNAAGEDEIVVVDSLRNAEKQANLNRVRIADYLDKAEALSALSSLGRLRAILHQGACTSTTEQDGRYMMANNYAYSKTLLQHALEQRIPFLYASSASVYGDGRNGFEEVEGCESSLNVYAFSKLQFDRYVRRVLPKAESQILGLRYFNVYGPREQHKGRMASVPLHMYLQHRRNETMRLFEGSDGFLRDFIHVDDVSRVNLHFLETGSSGIFNCGTGRARSFADVGLIMQRLCPGARLETVPFPVDLQGKYQNYTQADTRRLRSAGYLNDFVSLEDGLERYVSVLHGDERP